MAARKRKIRARRKVLFAAAPLCAGLLALAGYLYVEGRTGSVYHPHARFVGKPLKLPPPPEAAPFVWPNYGYTKNHLRDFPAPPSFGPPFHELWSYNEGALLEFPPVIYGKTLYQLADNATLSAIDTETGRVVWRKRLGALSASSPAVTPTTVYVTIFSRQPGLEAGEVVALDRETGAIRWSRDLPSPSESSPLVNEGIVYFGSQDGTVYALNAETGQTVWTYHAEGAVKASPTLAEGVLYFGDYAGNLQAVEARTGRLIWKVASEGAIIGSGTFYSTPAVAYGRVFLGNTDGRIYAYDQRTGALDWAVQTGAYVYSSPAVAEAPGLGPTIYIGSYDGHLYALNARTGAIDWSFDAGGKISGSPTIVGQIVYFSDLGTNRTFGLNITTGKPVFQFPEGAFDPVITNGKTIFLSGYNTLHALQPVSTQAGVAQAH